MSDVYEGGIPLDEHVSIDLRADKAGDCHLTTSISTEGGQAQMVVSPSSDELRELAWAASRCADAADEARQSHVANSNGQDVSFP